MNAQQTPGPWFADYDQRRGLWDIRTAKHDRPLGAYVGTAVFEGDAKRFAAAPTVLEALREAESFIAGFEGEELQEGIDRFLLRIRGALALAGATPFEAA
jgi:hypothetical protein